MLDAPRMVSVLKATGLSTQDIAANTSLEFNTIENIESFRSKNARVTSVEVLHDLIYDTYGFPWSNDAGLQLCKMAAIARGNNPSLLRELYGYSRGEWIESIRKARRRSVLGESGWTTLALGYSALLGELRRKPKNGGIEAVELGKAWQDVSDELLKRLGQLDTRNDADRVFVDILRFDVIQNQIAANWELSKMTSVDVTNLRRFVNRVKYFERYEAFNKLLPKCLTTHFNALGIASALKRRSLYKKIWSRLIAVDDMYANLRKFRKDKDAGPEFKNFFARAESGSFVVDQGEADEKG